MAFLANRCVIGNVELVNGVSAGESIRLLVVTHDTGARAMACSGALAGFATAVWTDPMGTRRTLYHEVRSGVPGTSVETPMDLAGADAAPHILRAVEDCRRNGGELRELAEPLLDQAEQAAGAYVGSL